MNLKWFVIFMVISIVSCIKSIQKIPPKYNVPLSNPDVVTLTLPSDKNSFPDVVYPTSILDIAKPFYFNTDDNYEVLGPFSEDVKSSYKLLSSINKPASKNSENDFKNKTENNKIVTTGTDAVMKVSGKENIIEECYNANKEDYVISFGLGEAIETENKIDFILDKTVQYYDYYNASLPQKVQNESCFKTPLHVKIDIRVFKERSNKTKEENVLGITNNGLLDNEENTTLLKQVTDTYSRNESSEEINISSEEHYTELQDINHSDFIKMLSVLLLDLLISTDNATSEMWNTTLIENESMERIVLESIDNLTNSESFGLMESNSTILAINRTRSDFESMLNFTEPLGHSDEESFKDSKEDYFLEFLVSIDSLCEINNTVETVAASEYLTNHEYLISENFTII